MPLPAYADIGKATKDLLAGGPATGSWQLDPKLSVKTTTTSGIAFTATLTQKSADKLDSTLKAAYATKKYSIDAAIDPANKVTVSASLSEVAPGVKLSSSVVLPDPASAKLALEYAMPYLSLKSTVGLNATPVLDVAASTGYQNVVLGAEASYDTSKSLLTKYNAALGYHAPDFQVAALLTDKLNTLKVSYSHTIAPGTTVGAEVARKLATSDTTFALAYGKKLSNGAITKVKVDGSGLLSALYETKLSSGEKFGGSVQLQATDLSKPLKYGFALDLA